MTTLRALRKLLALAAMFAAASLMLLPSKEAAAEPGSQNSSPQQGQTVYVPRTTATGGYSLRLRDIWGPAKMPPAPKDFGPHYDYPPSSLNGAPVHDPYPN
jgi:hypothetical protein